MKITIKAIQFLFIALLIFSCTPKDSDSHESFTDEKEEQNEVVLKGTVTEIEFGKDGYTTKIIRDNGTSLKALISISNVGGMDNYKSLEEGDFATLKGEIIKIATEQQMIVREIINVRQKKNSLLIKQKSFQGIAPGDKIATHKNNIEKSVLKNGEGEFVSFQIKNKQQGIKLLKMNSEERVEVRAFFQQLKIYP